MSTTRGPIQQSLAEVRTHVFDYTEDLLEGVTVQSAVVTHTKPGGDTVALSATVMTPKVYATLGPLTDKGRHILDCLAVCDDDEKLQIRLVVHVNY